jgi:hypothetical protein
MHFMKYDDIVLETEQKKLLSALVEVEFTPFNGQTVKPVSDVIVQKPLVICNRGTSGGVLGCRTLRDIQRSVFVLLPVSGNVQRTHVPS